MTRLVEVVGFALPQLTQGRAAAEGLELLEAAVGVSTPVYIY